MAKRIVILGGGFGGLRAALVLSRQLKKLPLEIRKMYEVVLVDRQPYHTFIPLLYEVATTPKEAADRLELKSLVTYPLTELLKNRDVRYVRDEVMHIDVEDGAVHLKGSKLQFDYLVLGLGSESNYFGIPGLREHSFSLKSFDDALLIRNTIWSLIKNGAEEVHIVIGGGGSTGIELASEIREWVCTLEKRFNKLCRVKVTIIEGTPTILPGFDARVIKKISTRLQVLGVGVVSDDMIRGVSAKEIALASGKKISFDAFVWTGGVKATSLTEKLSLKRERQGRIEIIGALECLPESPDLKIYGKIYAVGDIACIYNQITKQPVPQVARAAISQGSIAALNIIEEIKKEHRLTKSITQYIYTPKSYPYIIPAGGKFVVAKIGPFVISGLLGWVLKGLVELNYLVSIMPFGRAFKIWLRGLSMFMQNDRFG